MFHRPPEVSKHLENQTWVKLSFPVSYTFIKFSSKINHVSNFFKTLPTSVLDLKLFSLLFKTEIYHILSSSYNTALLTLNIDIVLLCIELKITFWSPIHPPILLATLHFSRKAQVALEIILKWLLHSF